MSSIHIVGVINVTPDSFHDGGQFTSVDAAVAAAKKMIADGADIIEIGGESTGPKSKDISVDEELHRVIPVITAIKKEFPKTNISIDTYKANVAEAAIKAGVMMVNDVTAGRGDRAMLGVIAKASVQYVMMYAKDPSARTTIASVEYDDVVGTVRTFLEARIKAAEAAGIAKERLIIDPGLGHFLSSEAKYSFTILAHLAEFHILECPLFVSPSRKSFVAGSEKLPTKERLPGTIAASAVAALHGAAYIRTHDVLEVRRACEIAQEIRAHGPLAL